MELLVLRDLKERKVNQSTHQVVECVEILELWVLEEPWEFQERMEEMVSQAYQVVKDFL